MPNASGYITTTDIRRMCEMRQAGMSFEAIAVEIGCGATSAKKYTKHIGRPMKVIDLTGRRERAERYERIVQQAAAFVPTFGGGR